MDVFTSTGMAGRIRSGLGPVQLIALGVCALVLLPAILLTVLSPAAWPIPVIALAGLVSLVLTGRRRARRESDEVSAEAASGISQLEGWLQQRHHS